MKKILFILLITMSFVSCVDELPCYVYNPNQELITDKVDSILMLELVNQARTNEGLNSVSWDNTLYKAAQLQSSYMFETNNNDHYWCDGTTPNDRAILVGFNGIVGENIAWGYETETRVFDGDGDGKKGWMNSEGHRKNILKEEFNVIGVAKKGNKWTMVLGYKM